MSTQQKKRTGPASSTTSTAPAKRFKTHKEENDEDFDEQVLQEEIDRTVKEATEEEETHPQEVKPDKNGEYHFTIGKELERARVYKFKKSILVDFRKYYVDKATGETRPTQKGISLSVESWNSLKNLIPQIDEALEKIAK